MALGNHRKSIRSEIAGVTERMRKIQTDALKKKYGAGTVLAGDLSPGAVVLLVTGIPKFLNLEKGVGVKTAHAEVVRAFERYLNSIEPPVQPRKRKTASPSRRR